MNFAFSEDQDMIRKSAADFVKGASNLERIRKIQENGGPGYAPELYQQMADAGWLGCIIPEEYGGMGLGYVDLVCILEELGRGLMPEPLVTSAVLGANPILLGGTEEQKQDLLPKVVSGELKLTVGAYELDGRFEFTHVATTAEQKGEDYVLNGEKAFVPDAATSDRIIVSARTSGAVKGADGITLFMIDSKAPGVEIKQVSTVDRRPRAMVRLTDVKVPASGVIGQVGQGAEILEKTIDRAIVAMCAEMVGGMEALLAMSVAYSKERVQFDRPIGSFQAIKHKAANMYVELETAKSALYYAAMTLDDNMEGARAAISCAKALCGESFVHIGQDAIQIHGGIGFTDEHDAHLYYKRALAYNVALGDPTWHRDRYATARGF